MGSEQSTQSQSQARLPAVVNVPKEATSSGNDSPGASVCSDVDLPYISYTLNRPIGDSPKTSGRGSSTTAKRNFQQRKPLPMRRVAPHAIVVVKEGRLPTSADKDEDVVRLQQIPMFLPIMRGTLGLPGARDPEVLEGIDSGPWLRLCARYQSHLASDARTVSSEQNAITSLCRQVDAEANKIHSNLVERQKRGAQTAERLSHVKHVSQHLTRCHALLEQLLISAKELNDNLPSDKRLEDFDPSVTSKSDGG